MPGRYLLLQPRQCTKLCQSTRSVRRRLRMRGLFLLFPGEQMIESVTRDAEDLGSSRLVAARLVENEARVPAFELIEREQRGRRCVPRRSQVGGQVSDVDEGGFGHHGRVADHILEFAYIAGPRVAA